MKTYRPLILLAISAFWACIAGGYIPLEGQTLTSSALLAAIQGDPAVPLLSHALIFLPIAAALIWVLAERQIQQVPTNRVAVPLAILFGLIIGTAPLTLFKSATLPQVAEWVAYGFAFFAVVAIGGRKQGPLTILAAVFLGCTLVAILGLREYGNNRVVDPTWRIFATWIGPNALVGILDIGLLVGLGIMLTQERTYALLAGLACALIGFAVILTQSKGGLGAMAAGLIGFAFALVVWGGKDGLKSLTRVAAVLVLIGLLAFGLTASQRQAPSQASAPTSASPISRFTDAAGSQEQSFEFRKLLWQSAAELIKENPAGRGAGTFRFWSARPGLTTQTQLAHESYLQLAVESSLFAPIALFVGLVAWVYYLFRSGRGVPLDNRYLRAGVFGAVAAISTHSLIDSDLHYFGIGLVFFMLLGVGLLLSTDAVAPEFTSKGLRTAGAVVTGLIAVLLMYAGWAETLRAQAQTALANRNGPEAKSSLDTLRSIMPFDGEAWFLSSSLAQNPAERLKDIKTAVDLNPSTRYLRALAKLQVQSRALEAARLNYERALSFDPNNLLALDQILQLDDARGDTSSARRIARRLVSIENTPYFKVRSIPDLIPLETARARTYLARSEKDKMSLLEGALSLYKQYATRTVSQILSTVKNGGMNYGGQDVSSAKEAMEAGGQVARNLASLYRAAGRAADAVKVEADAGTFEETLESLR